VIRFSCEHCGHKMGVEETHVGKRGKCPACGTIVTVPAESTLIEFDCGDCGRRLAVPKIQSGKKVVCPNCQKVIFVPAGGETPAVSIGVVRFTCSTCKWQIEEPESSRGKLVECPHCHNYVAVPSAEIPAQEVVIPLQPTIRDDRSEEHFEQMQKDQGTIAPQEPDPVIERKLPWFIDIFLYPTSQPGLVHLAFFAGAKLVLSFLGMLPFSGILSILIALYMYWYVTECVRDSAAGRIRAPEAFATSGLGDMWSQARHIIGCYLIFAGPVGFYFLWTQRMDTLFWALLAYGVFFFPMALLACVMFDSIRGLNPLLLLASIFSTFFQYCGLVLLVAAINLAVTFFRRMHAPDDMEQNWVSGIFLEALFYGVWLYAVFIVAHLLGRFYWRNQEKLNWEV